MSYTKVLLILPLFSCLNAGILEEAYLHGIDKNSDMRIAHSAVALQIASSKNAQTLDSFNIQFDGYARYYIEQESAIKNPAFGLPESTVHVDFTKANANLTLSREIYNGYTSSLQSLGKKGITKASHFLKQNKQDFVYKITTNYIEILKAYDTLLLSKSNAQVANYEYLQSVEDSHVGVIDTIELDIANSKKVCIDVTTELNLDSLNNALDKFKVLTKYDIHTIAKIREDLDYDKIPLQSFDNYSQLLRKHNPKLQQLQSGIEIAKEQVNLVSSQYSPSVNGQLGYEYTQNYTPMYLGDSYESGFFVGASAVIPLYTGGRSDTSKQKAIANVQCETLKKVKAEQELLLALVEQYRVLISSRRQIKAAQYRAKSLKKQFDQAQVRHEVGQVKAVEVAKIRYEYLTAKNQLHTFEYNFLLAYATLEHISGISTEESLLSLENLLENNTIQINNLIRGL